METYAILIVDDEKNVSRLLKKVFARQGYLTHVASNASEALEIIDRNQIDIVITDIRMPDVSGMELLKRIKDLDPSIHVIMMTAFATLETAIEALRMGARDYIIKPFDLDEVVMSVERVIASTKNTSEDEIAKIENHAIQSFFLTRSPVMQSAIQLIKQVADSKATVLLYGETGTGKELAAQALHQLSTRKLQPFIKVNCAAIPETLLESELFGYEKGAFTGATAQKPGKFELANGGTFFMDEIGDISPIIQVKLLRVLQEREFERLGGTKTIQTDVRIVAATHRDLAELIKTGDFREDLYYRLNVVPITIPPLRERKEDIEGLINYFLSTSAFISEKPQKRFSAEALHKLIHYDWPGNIRELQNIVERCVVISANETIDMDNLPSSIVHANAEKGLNGKLVEAADLAERDVIIRTLQEYGGNRTNTAQVLGISRRSLHRKINKYNIMD